MFSEKKNNNNNGQKQEDPRHLHICQATLHKGAYRQMRCAPYIFGIINLIKNAVFSLILFHLARYSLTFNRQPRALHERGRRRSMSRSLDLPSMMPPSR